jgi:pseudouridine-5'-phosphate glycosidase
MCERVRLQLLAALLHGERSVTELTRLLQRSQPSVSKHLRVLRDQQLVRTRRLETHGVPVLSCGQDNFAAFYTRDSGFRADYRLDDAQAQARFIRTKWALGLGGGVVLSTPVPQAAALPREEIDAITEQALAEAAAQDIVGKAVTPFLLARIKALTGGRSLATNIALVKHNAEVGARLAVALACA